MTIVHTFTYPSSRENVHPHTVVVYDTGKVSCSCRGFSTPNKCWHIRDAAKRLGHELDTSTWGASLGPKV